MYKLVLVDDEKEVRQGLLQNISWNECGFEIAGEAENGREALEIAERVMPDVVISDIKMPFMDGLQLAEILREKLPTVKILLLTGFDEFEYAQKAIRLNVLEYVLKPVSSPELVAILLKVKANMDREIAQRKDLQILREHFMKNLPVLKEKFLSSMITGRLKKNDILKKSQNYGIELVGNGYIVSVVRIDGNNFNYPASFHDGLQSGEINTFNLPQDKELLEFAMLNIVDEIVCKHRLGTAFLHNDGVAVITVSCDGDSDTVMGKTIPALEEIRQSMEKYLKFTVSIGVGNVCYDLSCLNQSYQNAVSALDYRVILGNNRVICMEDIEPRCAERTVFDELKKHALASCIKVGTIKEISDTVDSLFEGIAHTGASLKDYQIYLLGMLTTILNVAMSSDIDMEEVFGSSCNLFVELYNFNDTKSVRDWIVEICAKVMNRIVRDRQNTCRLIVEKAKEYAMRHYQESDITISKVCKHIHISIPHFSSLFKKETGTTFMNYLLQIRMESAKELLRTTDMKTFEIAAKVGYSEPNYFSYSFKKSFGISPTEFRNGFMR